MGLFFPSFRTDQCSVTYILVHYFSSVLTMILKQKLRRILPNFGFFLVAVTSLVITYYDVCQLCILYQCSPVLLRIHSAPNLEQLYCKSTAGSKTLTREREIFREITKKKFLREKYFRFRFLPVFP